MGDADVFWQRYKVNAFSGAAFALLSAPCFLWSTPSLPVRPGDAMAIAPASPALLAPPSAHPWPVNRSFEPQQCELERTIPFLYSSPRLKPVQPTLSDSIAVFGGSNMPLTEPDACVCERAAPCANSSLASGLASATYALRHADHHLAACEAARAEEIVSHEEELASLEASLAAAAARSIEREWWQEQACRESSSLALAAAESRARSAASASAAAAAADAATKATAAAEPIVAEVRRTHAPTLL